MDIWVVLLLDYYNKVAVNILLFIYIYIEREREREQSNVFLLPVSRIAWSHSRCIFNFYKMWPNHFPKWLYGFKFSFHIPISNVWKFPLFQIHSTFGIVSLFNFSSFRRYLFIALIFSIFL